MKMTSTTSVVCVFLLGILTVAESAAVVTQAKCPATYKMDMYLLRDTSGSIPAVGMSKLTVSLTALLKLLPIGSAKVQIAAGNFNTKFTHLFNLNKYSKSADVIKQFQAKVTLQGMTDLAGALKTIRQSGYLTDKAKGSRAGVPKKLCIFTDGNSDNQTLTVQEANLIRALGIEIIVFTIGMADVAEAIAIAGGRANVFSATSFATISPVLNSFVQHICTATPATTTPKPTTTTPKPTTTTPKPTTTTPKPTTTTPKPTTTTPKPTTTTPKPTTTTPKPTTTTPAPTTTTPAPTTTTPEPTTTTPEPSTTTPAPANKPCSSAEIDIIVAIDSSGSIGEENFHYNTDFVSAFVEQLSIGDSQTRIGLFTFGTYPVQALRLSGDIQLIKQAIGSLKYQGSTTETHLVITAAINEYILNGRPGVKKVLTIVTDGLSSSPALTLALATYAKNFGVYIIGIGVGDEIDQDELRNISSSGTFLFAKDYSQLSTLIYSLVQGACTDAPPATASPGTPQPPPTPGPTPPTPSPVTPCSPTTQLDVVFLIDSSGSMGKKNFQFNSDLISRYVDAVGISETTIRIAVFTFGTHPRYVFGLTGDVPTIRKGISAMKYQASTTETYLALEAARDEIKLHGRPGVAHAAVLVTDGRSTTQDLTLSEAAEVKREGTEIIVVAVGDMIDQAECRAVSSSGTFLYVDQYSNLPNLTASIGQKTCQAASTPVTADPDIDSDSSSDSSSSDSSSSDSDSSDSDEQCAAA